jgi:hypothetical protein
LRRLDAVGPKIHEDLPPVMGGMIDDMEKNILKTPGVMFSFRVFVFDTPFPKIGIGYDFKRISLVVIMDFFPSRGLVHLPYPEFGRLFHNSGIPNMMGVEDMVEKGITPFWNGFKSGAKGNQLLVRMVIIVKYLMEKCLHNIFGLRRPFLPL